MDIISKDAASSQGLKYYFTGKACCRGHLSQRWVKNGHCVECKREDNHRPENVAARKKYAKTERSKSIVKEGQRKWQAKNGAAYAADYRVKNSEQCRKVQRDYYYRNREARIALAKEVQSRDPQKKKGYMRDWQKKNAAKCVAHTLKRDATQRQSAVYLQTEKPFIELMYELGRELGLHVDHIIPQTHKDVTGLHCLLNLRLLAPVKNMSKGNKFDASRANLICPV